MYAVPTVENAVDNPFANPDDFMDESELVDLGADLTEDDKVYLAMK